jgi:hypothetical protein
MQTHGDNAGHAEDQREGEEVPLLSKPIHIYAVKQFHWFSAFLGLEP